MQTIWISIRQLYEQKFSTGKSIAPHSCVLALCFAVTVIQCLLLRMESSTLPLLDHDSWGYLGPSFFWFDSGTLSQLYGRSFPYPFFLSASLRLFGSLDPILWIQQAISLLTIALSFNFLRLLLSLKSLSPALRLIGSCIGSLLVNQYATSTQLLFFETFFRPEAILPLIIILIVTAAWQWFDNPENLFLSGLLAASPTFLYLLRPNVGLGALFLFSALIFLFPLAKESRHKIRIQRRFLVFSFLGYFLMSTVQSSYSSQDHTKKFFLPLALVACHGPYILPYVEREISNRPPEHTQFLKGIKLAIQESMQPERNIFPLLGIDPDYFMYGSKEIRHLDKFMRFNHLEPQVYWHFFLKFVSEEPMKYMGKVLNQLALVYSTSGQALSANSPISWGQSYQAIDGVLKDQLGSDFRWDILKKYSADVRQLPIDHAQNINAPQSAMNRVVIIWNTLFPLLSLGSLLIFLIVIFQHRNGIIEETVMDYKLSVFTLLAGGLLFFHHLSVSLIGSLEVRRYVDSMALLTFLFLALSLIQLISLLERRIKRKRRSLDSEME